MRSLALVLVLLLCPGLSWSVAPATAAVPAASEAEAPGEVVLAAIAAQRSGDFEAWMRAWHPRAWQGKETETRAMIEHLREHSPESARVLDVRIDGDLAVVALEATFPGGGTATTTADLERFEGRWRVVRM